MGVEKDFYMEHPAVGALTRREVREWRFENRVRVGPSQHHEDDEDCPKPVRTWMEAAFPEFITAELEATGFLQPTVIQSQAWPVALSGRDMVGLASTGSGKTLCFALPAIVHVCAQVSAPGCGRSATRRDLIRFGLTAPALWCSSAPLCLRPAAHMWPCTYAQEPLQPGDGPIALMLAPTRELALQIKGECDRFGGSSRMKNTAVYGGVPKGPQQVAPTQALPRTSEREPPCESLCAQWPRGASS